MTKITNEYDHELKQYFDGIKYKLHVNRHKGKWENKTIEEMFELLRGEVRELEDEIKGGNQIATILEACDVGAMAMIIANVAMRKATAPVPSSITRLEDQLPQLKPNIGDTTCPDTSRENTVTSPTSPAGGLSGPTVLSQLPNTPTS